MDISWKTLYTAEFMITALTFLFKARYLSEKTFKAHFHVVPRAHHKLHLSASFIFKRKGPLCVEIGFTQTFLGKQNSVISCEHCINFFV